MSLLVLNILAAETEQMKQTSGEVKANQPVPVETDADFDHLTKAAEQMMANWAAEDDDHPPGQLSGFTSSICRG